MENLIFSTIGIEALKGELIEALRKEVQDCLAKSQSPNEQLEYITRKEAALILGISLPTLGKFTKEGIVPAYRISSRIRYKKSEVHESMNKIVAFKGKRGI